MPTPEFILDLRERIGHDLLWLMGVTAVVLRPFDDGSTRVLLGRRADNGAWTPINGILDPGEEPAAAAAREVAEETGVACAVEALSWVHVLAPTAYPNGDRVQFLDLTFRCRWTAGEAHPADGEATDVRWVPLGRDGSAPNLVGDPDQRDRIRIAAIGDARTRFEPPAG